MGKSTPRKDITILFDESRSESWTISFERASEVNPDRPPNSSYATVAAILANRGFGLFRNVDKRLSGAVLKQADLLVLLHPCDSRWERTTSTQSPRFSTAEIRSIQSHVAAGGSLLVITEYEHEKYGSNINDLIRPFGITVTNETVYDPTNHVEGNPTWVLADRSSGDNGTQFWHLVTGACFYRAAVCETQPPARPAICASETSSPRHASLISVAEYFKGRVAVVTDSDLFGDEYIDELGHRQLWINLIYWLCLPAFRREGRAGFEPVRLSRSEGMELWSRVKKTVNTLRQLQQSNGSISEADQDAIGKAVECTGYLANLLPKLGACFPHQTDYFAALSSDLDLWKDGVFGIPDFTQSLHALNPQVARRDALRHFVLFPMYTPNASLDVRFETLIIETLWPGWLAEIQGAGYRENDKFVPARLVDYSEGYASECAVFFPETVSIAGHDENRFGVIFCDREAARYQGVVGRAAGIIRLDLPPSLCAFLASPDLILDTYALWDLIHDTSHSRGELPFDPFMVRQKSPYWMYALEELRVDLRSFLEAHDLSAKIPAAEYVCYAVLFDRIFRFAVSGNRVRNYDALAGQLLFNALHARSLVTWRDNILHINWALLPDGIRDLYAELQALYREGQVVSKVTYWSAAHDLLCQYMAPNVASKWVKSRRTFEDESYPRALVALVHDDEFPLGSFHLSLKQKLALSYQ